MEDEKLTQEDIDFIEWLKTADQKTLNKAMMDTEKEIFRGKQLNKRNK